MQPQVGKWPTLRQVVDLFCAMGCVLLEKDDPLHPGKVIRFLYNEEEFGTACIDGYDMDMKVSPTMVSSWERQLGVEIPKLWEGPIN